MELVYGPFGRRKGNETANLIILLETSILDAAENNANNNFPIPNGSPQFGASSLDLSNGNCIYIICMKLKWSNLRLLSTLTVSLLPAFEIPFYNNQGT
jgi:hypothetical protein